MNWCFLFAFTFTTLCHVATCHRWNDNGFDHRQWQSRPPSGLQWGTHPGYMKYSGESKGSDEDSGEWGYGEYNNWKYPRFPPGPTASTKFTLVPSTPPTRMTTKPPSKITPSFTSWTQATPSTTPLPASTMVTFTAECIRSCPVTSEYNPVCGTNNVTYTNRGRLECARSCGVDVEVRRASTCAAAISKDSMDNGDNPATVTPTTVTPNWNVGKTTPSISKIMACLQTCPVTSEHNPVCGTDGVTYNNPSRLLCAQFCGVDVSVQKMSACHSSPTNTNCNIGTAPTMASTIPDNGSSSSTIQACIRSCSRTSEKNPVCGTDNITYMSISHLMCVKRCGVDVSLRGLSACPSNTNNNGINTISVTVTAPPSANTEGFKALACINQCPVTSEYNPVCGTNNITYINIGRLNCIKSCGIKVEVRRLTPCPPNNNNGDDVNVFSSQPTPGIKDEISTSTESTVTSYVTEGFTIPRDILDVVFNFSTPTPTTEEVFDIDQRFNTP